MASLSTFIIIDTRLCSMCTRPCSNLVIGILHKTKNKKDWHRIHFKHDIGCFFSVYISDEHFLLASAQIMDSPIVYCSAGFTKMTGYKKNQVVKKKANCSFMYGSLTTKDAVRLLRNAIQEKEPAQIEILFYKRDG